MNKIFTPFYKNGLKLKNHLTAVTMSRASALQNLPHELMASYYGQRSEAGLIITEATAIDPDAQGYVGMPGIYTSRQIETWKKITERVHQNDSKIFLQIVHTGRIGHQDNLPDGARIVGVSDMKAKGQIFTGMLNLQDFSRPSTLTTAEVNQVIENFVTAARNATEAGFDGVELHGAHGYLMEQFLHPVLNNRHDPFGGNLKNRARFLLSVAAEVKAAIGPAHVGIKLSPFSTLNDLPDYGAENTEQTYEYLAGKLEEIGIDYIHMPLGVAAAAKTYKRIREQFSGLLIYSSGLDLRKAEELLQTGTADLVGLGWHFIANLEIISKWQHNIGIRPWETNHLFNHKNNHSNYSLLDKGRTGLKGVSAPLRFDYMHP